MERVQRYQHFVLLIRGTANGFTEIERLAHKPPTKRKR